MPQPFSELLDIEGETGPYYSTIQVPASKRRDAGKLWDAIRRRDLETMYQIYSKYERAAHSGDVTGGPKQIRVADGVSRRLGQLALSAWIEYQQEDYRQTVSWWAD